MLGVSKSLALFRISQKMFPDNVEILEGGFWEPGSQGVLLNKTVAEHLERRIGFAFRTRG